MDIKEPYGDFQSAKVFAQSAINAVDSQYEVKFLKILKFCFANPSEVSGVNGSPVLSGKWIETKAKAFVNKRYTKKPSMTVNTSDPLISIIAEDFFEVTDLKLAEFQEHHKIAMAGENVIGSLLEEFIAGVVEPLGWIWCSGEMIKATDFIKFPTDPADATTLLQIKNRSNSENSSSASVRKGTVIRKWNRMVAKSGKTKWDEFPEPRAKKSLTEAKFQEFAKNRIAEWKIAI